MKPVQPVVIGESDAEFVAAKNDENYQPLPCVHRQLGNIVLSRWKLSDEEIETIIKTKSIFVYQQTLGAGITPYLVSTESTEVLKLPSIPPELETSIIENTCVVRHSEQDKSCGKTGAKVCRMMMSPNFGLNIPICAEHYDAYFADTDVDIDIDRPIDS